MRPALLVAAVVIGGLAAAQGMWLVVLAMVLIAASVVLAFVRGHRSG